MTEPSVFDDPTTDSRLRAEIRALGALLGQALVRHEGPELLALVEEVREEAEHDAVRLMRAIERSARENAEDKARDVVITAIQRVMVDHTAEATVTVVLAVVVPVVAT